MNKYSILATVLTLLGLGSEFFGMVASDKAMETEIKDEVARQVNAALRPSANKKRRTK